MKLINFIIVFFASILIACQKETSVEGDGNVQIALGSLQDSAGNCQNIIVNGIYRKDSFLNASNTLAVKVNFTQAGTFTIYSDTVNGCWFRLQSFAFVPGNQTVSIPGFGRYLNNIDATFNLFFNGKSCSFKVKRFIPVLPNGTGNDYFPTTNFSTWIYDNNLLSDTTVTSVIGVDKTVLGNRYRCFLLQIPRLSLTDTLLYRKDGAGNYYRYDTIATGAKTEYQILKDYNVVNDTFSSPIVNGTYLGNSTPVRYHFTMRRKNVRRTINGNTIDSIIIMQQETQYLIGGNFTTTGTYEFSYAKKIGLVNIEQSTGSSLLLLSPIRKWIVN